MPMLETARFSVLEKETLRAFMNAPCFELSKQGAFFTPGFEWELVA